MKTDILKKLIKESVREAIQEELKDILLEAVKSPKTVVKENWAPNPIPVPFLIIFFNPFIFSSFKFLLRSFIIFFN